MLLSCTGEPGLLLSIPENKVEEPKISHLLYSNRYFKKRVVQIPQIDSQDTWSIYKINQ